MHAQRQGRAGYQARHCAAERAERCYHRPLHFSGSGSIITRNLCAICGTSRAIGSGSSGGIDRPHPRSCLCLNRFIHSNAHSVLPARLDGAVQLPKPGASTPEAPKQDAPRHTAGARTCHRESDSAKTGARPRA